MILRFLLIAAMPSLFAVIFWQNGWLQSTEISSVSSESSGMIAPHEASPELTVVEFETQLLPTVNAARKRVGFFPMKEDSQLKKSLIDNGFRINLNGLSTAINEIKLPGFSQWAAAAATGRSLKGLLRTVSEQLSSPETAETMQLAWRITGRGQEGYEVIALHGQKLKELTLAGLNAGKVESFLSECPHCHTKTALHFESDSCGIMVDCPSCTKRCLALGLDTSRHYRYANEFIDRTRPPPIKKGTHPLDVMMTVWRTAVNRVAYVKDPEGEDTWQTPLETLKRGAGDCEDSSLLLADWLLASGIRTRVVLGEYNGSGHAWCVARVDGSDYLLESTNRTPDIKELPVVNPDDGYNPETLVDRTDIYVKAHPGQSFNSDYWSNKHWIRLPRVGPIVKPTAASHVSVTSPIVDQ